MRHRRPLSITAAVAALSLAWVATAQAQYQVVPPKNGGTIEGRVTLPGAVPPVPPVTTTKNQDVCGKTVPSPKATVVDPKTHGVEWVVVYLDNVTQGKAPADQYAIANQGCAFHPHVLAAMQGKTFQLENKDPVLHNTHIRFSGRTLLNVALSFHEGDAMYHPIKDQRILSHAGLVNVNCDAHEWMAGYVEVLTNPYFAVTGPDGSYKITDVPPGPYTVKVWHENLGEKTDKVTVPAGGKATLDITFAK
ncbi:MAG TPA: carboxypeptidase regulatory-like domain-containing protein [Thermoanaerobaculia bacterium]|nr:carboxypeptidase regulatory-like domain-containing protein [Thermoanaerobaculia bacterium]